MAMRVRAHFRLDAKLHGELQKQASQRRISRTSLLEEALTAYLDAERCLPIEERVMKRLDTFERRMGRMEWANNVVTEGLFQFVFYWLVRIDPLPERERDMAHALGRRRMEHFIDQVADRLSRKRTIVHESRRWETSAGK